MIRTVSIVPTILSDNKQEYREKVETINSFTRRVQIDMSFRTYRDSRHY